MVEPDTTALAAIVDGTELLPESKDGKIVPKFNC